MVDVIRELAWIKTILGNNNFSPVGSDRLWSINMISEWIEQTSRLMQEVYFIVHALIVTSLLPPFYLTPSNQY